MAAYNKTPVATSAAANVTSATSTASATVHKISRPIVGYEVVGSDALEASGDAEQTARAVDASAENVTATPAHARPSVLDRQASLDNPLDNLVEMHDKIQRPDMLVGSTYKIKSPLSPHALYVTVNDLVLNPGTPCERRRPFEIFINSKNMDHFQWIVALTRVISAVFRKGGEVAFLVEELRSVFDPRGGYFKKGGRMMPSLVAEIGDVIHDHLRSIGLIHDPELSPVQKKMIEEKRKAWEALRDSNNALSGENSTYHTGFPPESRTCEMCMHKAVIYMDGCMVCLNCGESKCG